MKRGLAIFVLTSATALTCISHVDVDGSPCPCPDGYSCCETLAKCMATTAVCPSTHPPSSGRPCQADSDCGAAEMCHSWANSGAPGGPRLCRQRCADKSPCADQEVCEITPHDGRPLPEMFLARLCVPATPPAGCEGQGCRAADMDQLGHTFCDGDTVRGWFMATNPRCGLTCQSVVVQDCSPGVCEAKDGNARCNVFTLSTPCDTLPCEGCGTAPGSFFCDGPKLTACVAMPASEAVCLGSCPCTHLCYRQVVKDCGSCVVGADGPSCLP
jgi:hypothetical protein